jgi:type I restriction enzyme, S subunit
MAGEWKVLPLESCMDAVIDYRGKTPKKTAFGIPLITAKVVKGGRIETPGEFIASDDYETWMRRGIPKAGDVVVTTEAPLGEVAQLGTKRVALAQRLIALRGKSGLLDNGFLKFLMQSEDVQEQLRARASGTTVLGIKQSELRKVLLSLPPLPEQRAIAHILGTLDDKIELNRRMNETLEAMARALFKSWFVDFDPVRAKAEGRDPGLPQHLADLFPDSFEDSELGEIPRGWEVLGLDKIANFLNGLAMQKYPPDDGCSLPVIKIAQLRAGHTTGADRASVNLPPDYIIQDGDILFSWSGSLECILWAGGQGALNQHLFEVTSEHFPRWLCYLGVHQHLGDFRHIAAGKATTMGHIQRKHLSDAKLAVPSSETLDLMDNSFRPLIENIWRRAVQSCTLASLRDTLLPKLISGELRIKDAERFVERAL